MTAGSDESSDSSDENKVPLLRVLRLGSVGDPMYVDTHVLLLVF